MDELKSFIEDYKKTNWNLLLREDFGNYSLKEIKPDLDSIKNFIDPLVESSYKLSTDQQNSLIRLISNFMKLRKQIKNHADTSQNQNIINDIANFKNEILDNFQNLYLALVIQDRHDANQTLANPEIEVKKYQSLIKDLEKELIKTRQSQSQLSEQTIRAEASRYGDFFYNEAKKNERFSLIWGVVFLFFSLIACLVAYCFLGFDQNITASSFPELLIKGNVINKIFIFSVIILIISTLRREYLALKHQFILNTHRHNAISSHKEILSSIEKTTNESDKEISNAILLELTKAMFSSEDSGFIKSQKESSAGNKIIEISRPLFNNSKN